MSSTATKLTGEAVTTFEKKGEHFLGMAATVEMLDEARSGENLEDEKAMVTTVGQKLEYLVRPLSRHIDAMLQNGPPPTRPQKPTWSLATR